MTRGLGKLQRDLLEILEESTEKLSTITLAAIAYRVQPDEIGFRGINDAQHVAVRRALRGLYKRGLVTELGRRRHRDNRRYWASLKVGLPERLEELRFFSRGFAVRSSPTKAAEVRAEMIEIQERIKQLGIAPTR